MADTFEPGAPAYVHDESAVDWPNTDDDIEQLKQQSVPVESLALTTPPPQAPVNSTANDELDSGGGGANWHTIASRTNRNPFYTYVPIGKPPYVLLCHHAGACYYRVVLDIFKCKPRCRMFSYWGDKRHDTKWHGHWQFANSSQTFQVWLRWKASPEVDVPLVNLTLIPFDECNAVYQSPCKRITSLLMRSDGMMNVDAMRLFFVRGGQNRLDLLEFEMGHLSPFIS